MKKKTRTAWITGLMLLLLWQILAVNVANDILVPYPVAVLSRMVKDLGDPGFYQVVISSLVRMMKGYGMSLILAALFAFTAACNETVRYILSPLNVIVKTIPNLSYIMVFLILLGSEGSVMVTSFCILFPLFYSAILLSQDMMETSLKQVLLCYPEKGPIVFFKVRLPQSVPYLLDAMKTGFGLGLRVCIMAEILTQVRIGIGRQMSYAARVALDMTGLFSWTLWIILISVAGHLLLEFVQKMIEKQFL